MERKEAYSTHLQVACTNPRLEGNNKNINIHEQVRKDQLQRQPKLKWRKA